MKIKLMIMGMVFLTGLVAGENSYAQSNELLNMPKGLALNCSSHFLGVNYFWWAGHRVANLSDNYNSTQHGNPDGTASFMSCHGASDKVLECKGKWSSGEPAQVIIVESSTARYFARFKRAPERPGQVVTLPCRFQHSPLW